MNSIQNKQTGIMLSKVPQVTLFFWIIKVLCTTVGETFSDFLSFNVGLGLPITTVIMGVAFVIVLIFQFKANKYEPGLYWLTVVLISVFGTLVTDIMTDEIGVPLETSTLAFTALLGLTFIVWFLSEKTLSIHSIFTRKREAFYWLTILFTFALGTAVGDLYSEQLGLGYLNTGIAVAAIIALTFLAWKLFKLDSVLAFWFAYVFTRPLGASLGDYLSQPKEYGGLGFGATMTSVIFLTAILAVVIYLAITRYDIEPKTGTTDLKFKGTIAKRSNVLAQTVSVLAAFLVISVGGYFWLSSNIAGAVEADQTTLSGQLDGFISLETDMLDAVNIGDFNLAASDANELEHEWDISEPGLRAIDSETWTDIDGTIDDVLAATRSKNPDADRCLEVLNNSLSFLDVVNMP